MATKKEMVKDILAIKEVDTESNLMGKTAKELESILEGLQGSETAVQEQVVVAPTIDVEAIKAQIEAELRAKIMAEITQAQEAQPVVTNVVNTTAPTKRVEIDRFEQIPVMNTTNGTLIYKSRKTGATYLWSDYGSVEYLEFQELTTMRSGDKIFLQEPFVLVLDDDAVNYLGLTKMYENLIDLENIEDIFDVQLEEFKKIIDNAPKGLVHTIVSKARELQANGQLDSIQKVKYLNEKFGTDIGQRG